MFLTRRPLALLWAVAVFSVAAPTTANAYLGPGMGLGAVAAVLGVVGSILLGLVSIIWYPIKRLIRRLRRKDVEETSSEDEAA